MAIGQVDVKVNADREIETTIERFDASGNTLEAAFTVGPKMARRLGEMLIAAADDASRSTYSGRSTGEL